MPEIDRPKQLAFELDEPKPKFSLGVGAILDAFNYIPQGVRRNAVRPLPLDALPAAGQNQPRALGGLIEREQRVRENNWQMFAYEQAVERARRAIRLYAGPMPEAPEINLPLPPPPALIPIPEYPRGIYEVPNFGEDGVGNA